MAEDPPYGLDPHIVVRSPDAVPLLFKRGMVNVIERSTGELYDKVMRAFNIIAYSLVESKRIRVKQGGALKLLPLGIKRTTEITHDRSEIRKSEKKMEKFNNWIKQLKTTFPDRFEKSWWEEQGRKSPTE